MKICLIWLFNDAILFFLTCECMTNNLIYTIRYSWCWFNNTTLTGRIDRFLILSWWEVLKVFRGTERATSISSRVGFVDRKDWKKVHDKKKRAYPSRFLSFFNRIAKVEWVWGEEKKSILVMILNDICHFLSFWIVISRNSSLDSWSNSNCWNSCSFQLKLVVQGIEWSKMERVWNNDWYWINVNVSMSITSNENRMSKEKQLQQNWCSLITKWIQFERFLHSTSQCLSESISL